MKSCFFPVRRGVFCFVLVLLVAFIINSAEAKDIRLRNGVIRPSASPALSAPGKAVSGLFLVQLRTNLNAEMRDQLAAAGLTLLHYIPEDTYLARGRAVELGLIRALPFVEWVGDYEPGHKVQGNLRAKAAQAHARGGPTEVGVAVLLARDATAAELASARGMFQRIHQDADLRSGRILRGNIIPARVDLLAQSEAVLWVEPGPEIKLFDESSSKIVAGDGGPNQLYTQSLGYDGAGVSVAVADSGLNNGDAATMHPDLFGRTPAFFYYEGLTDAADEHSHGTHVAGIIAGNGATGEMDENGMLYGLGVAPGASIIAQRLFDAVGGYFPPPTFERMTRDAYRAGAVIGSNSWGDDTQGRYDLSAMEFDELVRDADAIALGDQQYILEFSAGNAGNGARTIGSPAVAKNVIATGACQSDRSEFLIYGEGRETMADFSSRGPCEDGRIKPDVVAPGTYIASLQSYSATADYAWAEISPNYQYQGGTSQAGPHVSGAAAVFVQYYRDTHTNSTPSPALVKAALINSAINLDDSFGTGPVPNMDEGWGRVDLPTLLDPSLSFIYQEQGPLLTNNAVYERRVLVGSSDLSLIVTLTYTDVPGLPAAIPALVNDLDLEIVAPDGTLYRGNQFADGESIPNPVDADRINNVEEVMLSVPVPGEYIVRVRAHRIAEDALRDTPADDQDFALVISGAFASPGTGILTTDRHAYRAPDRIKLQLTDSNLAGQTSASVKITSTTEPGGETLVLQSSSSSGVFTGSIATVTGPAVVDNKLQVTNGNAITAQYFDASAQTLRTAGAVVDMVPPQLSAVSVTSQFGQLIVTWTSDEPANSIVRFGTNSASLGGAVTNQSLVMDHQVALGRFTVGETVYLTVSSVDEAGNLTLDNKGGALYSIIVPETPLVLVVDGETVEYAQPYAPDIATYTSALTALHIPSEVWSIPNLGSAPTTNILNNYRAVIWRVSEWDIPSPAVQNTISNYLQSGGSLLIASMDMLSRFADVNSMSFPQNVLHVANFVPDPGSTGAEEVLGTPFDYCSGLDLLLDFSFYADDASIWPILGGPDFSDTITPGPGASPILKNSYGDIVGLRYPGFGQSGNGRLVFLSFALDAVPMTDGVNDRTGLLRKLMSFLAPGVSGIAELSLNSPFYRLPSVATAELADLSRAGSRVLSARARSSTEPAGFAFQLTETPVSSGIFRGSFNIVSATNAPAAGRLRATPADAVTIEYTNAATALNAIASIDVAGPTISNVVAEPDFTEAVVAWETSEPTDALVQFGASLFLDRSVYAADFADSHMLTLSGLVPDRTYYYQVVSRDIAGNVIVDDNHGQMYTFYTPKPLFTPWQDLLETGAPGWTTYSEPILEGGAGPPVEWQLGIATSELAPTNAQDHVWGVNLSGGNIDMADAYLISPPVYLNGGNQATLTFWHNYDFPVVSDTEIEYGTVYVSADNGPLTELVSFGDSSFGWEPVTLNLTPYIGKMVYIVWEYFFFSMDVGPRPGWLINDVAITTSTVQTPPSGTIVVTNNLWHGWFLISGAKATNGVGSAVFTNMPAGQYTFEPREVEYYNLPASQIKTLTSGGVVTFESNYTFPDANANGISDSWELAWFGNVSPYRSGSTDSDADGFNDRAEFLSGTDPLRSPPKFKVTATRVPPAGLRLEWPSAAGQQYRVLASSNALAWNPLGGWMEATASVTRVSVPLAQGGVPGLYKIQVGATNGPANVTLPTGLQVSSQRLPDGSLRLIWETSYRQNYPSRAYRVCTSTNLVNWVPQTSWTAAPSRYMTNTVPAPAGTSPRFYRVEVAP